MDLSVSIVSWNTRDLLDDCLKSVFETTEGIEFEVIVVDNASSDGSADMVREKYPQVKVIANNQNSGFASANNQAYAASLGRYFMLLNPDTIVHSGLQGAVSFLDGHRDAAVVGCKSLNVDGSIQISWNRCYPTLVHEILPQRVKDWLRTTNPHKDTDSTFRAAWVGGVCMTVRKEAVEQVGLLDEGYRIYTEETDWCRRFAASGWLVMHSPCVVITHLGGQSTRQAGPGMRAELARSKVRFMTKFRSLFEARCYARLLNLSAGARLVVLRMSAAVRGRSKNAVEKLRVCRELRAAYAELLAALADREARRGT